VRPDVTTRRGTVAVPLLLFLLCAGIAAVVVVSGRVSASDRLVVAGTGTGHAAGVAVGCTRDLSCDGRHRYFSVRVGSATGLYPGRRTTVPVRYANPNGFAISVVRATVTARAGRAGRCAARYLRTGSYRLRPAVRIRAHNAVMSSVPIGMRRTAPDACKGARWTIRVGARAVRR
jgi:hypothetical protein